MRFRTITILFCASWVNFGQAGKTADTFGDLTPMGVCGGETPQFYSRYSQAGSPSEYKPAYLHAGIQSVPGGGLDTSNVEPLKDITVPSFKKDKTLLALNLPEAGFPSSMFAYKVGNCQDKWANDFFCDKPFCQCPYKFGEWIAVVRDPSEGTAFKDYPQDKKDYIQNVYNGVRENPAYGTSGKWELQSVSVFRTTEPKVFARFNYKSMDSREQFMSVAVPIKEGAASDSGLVGWMCAVMGKYCGKCTEAASLTATTTATTTTATTGTAAAVTIGSAQTKIVFKAMDVFRYYGQCQTTPMAGATPAQLVVKKKRFNPLTGRRACKVECMSENTDGTFNGGTVLHPNGGGSKCHAFSWHPSLATGENCFIYQEANVASLANGITTPPPGGWECFSMEVTKTFEHEREESTELKNIAQTAVNNLHTTATHQGDAKYFKPSLALAGGFKAKRFKVKALQPNAAAAYFSPYMWIELEETKTSAGRRLAVTLDNNFWWQQIGTGAAGFIPVSTAEYQKIIACVPVTGAEMTAAHVVTTDRICVDATTEGYCIQQTLELTWIWPLLAGIILAFILGYLCRGCHAEAPHQYEVIVQDKGKGSGGPLLAPGGTVGAGTTMFHIGH